ncbi:TPA: hypothetical protein ACIVVN_000677 [Salmonella enterica subsp. enterica serovar Kottbus]
MKTILKNVQLAVAGTSEDGHAITADMLRTIVSNFKGNNYPQIVKGSLSQKTERHEVVGYVTFVYFKECNGEAALFGDLEFIQFYDMSTLKETFDNRVYPAIEITIQHPGYESLYRLAFTDIQFTKGLRKVNFRKCECIGREEHVQKTLEPSAAVLFNKKYDNEKSGLPSYINTSEEKPSNYYDTKENNAVITFDNEGEDLGNGIMRYGHYCNGALMGYVLCGVTEFGGDYRPRHPLDILEKFVEHQRGNLLRKSSTNT